jgi:hypothetical protein
MRNDYPSAQYPQCSFTEERTDNLVLATIPNPPPDESGSLVGVLGIKDTFFAGVFG